MFRFRYDKYLGYLLLYLIGILLVGSMPALFFGTSVDPISYWDSLNNIITNLFTSGQFTYYLNGVDRPVFPRIVEPWLYSITVLFSSFILSFICALVLGFGTILLPTWIVKQIKGILFFFESIPDLLIIALFQLLVIFMYKETGILFFDIASFKEATPYTLPILAMAILPTIFLYRYTVHEFESELQTPYIELAKGKGLTQSLILFRHVLRNAFTSIFFNSKFILWFMLSNLLIVEYTFGTNGLIQFLLNHNTTEIFTIGIFLFFMPIWLLFFMGKVYFQRIDPTLGEIE